jgi:universal stress protein E
VTHSRVAEGSNMQRIDRILAVIDPTVETHHGAAKAARLARACGATLELFVCDFDPALSGQPFFDTDALRLLREEFVSERVQMLEHLAEELRAGGLNVETHVHWDNPLFRGILRRIEESGTDLVVKEPHYHSLLRRTLVSNTDWNLIRTCPVPLLLAKAGAWPAHPRFLAAIDPGHAGDKPAALDHDIVATAQWLAQRLGGEVRMVHAFFPAALLAMTVGMAGMPLAADVTASDIIEHSRKEVEAAVRRIADARAVAPEAVRIVQGAATEALPAQAGSERADVLVMGAVSRSRLQEVFIGSTAERVLDRIPCDVLVVKPGDFREKLPF